VAHGCKGLCDARIYQKLYEDLRVFFGVFLRIFVAFSIVCRFDTYNGTETVPRQMSFQHLQVPIGCGR
jgi:hypothetical protein